jgi:FlaA1/EpsC-like NDP-sugar epimerase
MFYQIKNRNFWIMLLGDITLLSLSYYFAYYLRFGGSIPARELANFSWSVIWIVPVKLLCFFFFDLYKGMWRYTSLHDLIKLIKACVAGSCIILLTLLVTVRFEGFPRSIFVIDFLLTFVFTGGFRVGIRLLLHQANTTGGHLSFKKSRNDFKRLLIIGAGDASEKLLREIQSNRDIHYDVVGLLDDDRTKVRKTIHGVPVIGTTHDIGHITRMNRIDEIVIAVPSASAIEMRRFVECCEKTGIPYKTLPALSELLDGRVSVSSVREVHYEDLLRREPVRLEVEQIGEYLTDKRVMVTGGAGSIGAELCRQIACFNPAMLILADRNESGLYETELELVAKFPELKTVPVLGPIQYRYLMERIFHRYHLQVVFHAAAYKHVPMMETQPWEAIFNNIVGSQTLLDLCHLNGVERVVVVSTDKAVRPTNIMGASKRIVELLTQIYAREYNSRCMAVRFGNVVGSAGSVVPLFKKQIERGGPVTVTHPKVTRYFMTIPEAAQLILQAGAIGNGGEIFILKMGTPVRIDDMARDLIRLSGFEPDVDVLIKYTGLRPGEKLYEELITEGEGITETEHDEIMVLNCENGMCLEEMSGHIKELIHLAEACDAEEIKKALKRIVPEYMPWSTSQGEIIQPLSTECQAPTRFFQADVVGETSETSET